MVRRDVLIDLLALFKRANSAQNMYYDNCYSEIYDQKLGEKIYYNDILDSLLHIKIMSKIIIDDITRFEAEFYCEPSCLLALSSLRDFLIQLLDCQDKMNRISTKLSEKANGSFFSYPLHKYAKDTRELNKSMRILEEAGNKLQDNYEIMLKMLNTLEE